MNKITVIKFLIELFSIWLALTPIVFIFYVNGYALVAAFACIVGIVIYLPISEHISRIVYDFYKKK